MNKSFEFMTLDDEMLIAEASTRVEYEEGDRIITRGDHKQAVFIVNNGLVRIEIDQIIIARKGPGAVIGEMGFIRGQGASADVVADSPVAVDKIDGHRLNSLLFSVPGMATRFYASLAGVLAERLEKQISWAAQVPTSVRMPQFRPRKSGNGMRRTESSAALEQQLNELQKGYLDWLSNPTPECAAVLFQQTMALVDRCCAAENVCEHSVRRIIEESSLLRLSPFHLAATRQDRGFPADYQTLQTLHYDLGEDSASRTIQNQLVELSAVRALKLRGKNLAEACARQVRDWPEKLPLPLLLVGCSSSLEIQAVVRALTDYGGSMVLDIVDPDPLALGELGLWRRSGVTVRRIQANPLHLARGDDNFLTAQYIIAVPALADFLDDETLLKWLSWAFSMLLPGGCILLCHLNAHARGFTYLRQALGWPLQPRSRDQLEALLTCVSAPERYSVHWSPVAESGAWMITIHGVAVKS